MSRPPELPLEVRLEKWNRLWDYIYDDVMKTAKEDYLKYLKELEELEVPVVEGAA